MYLPTTISRRTLLIGVFALVALALGGMIWATLTTLELDYQQRLADHERRLRVHREEFENEVMIAMHRLSTLDEQFGREMEHPFDYFKSKYWYTGGFDGETGLPLEKPILLQSPLASAEKPDWLLLHFAAMTEDSQDKWESPEVDVDNEWVMPASAIPAADRIEQARALNWLNALRNLHDPVELRDLVLLASAAASGQNGDAGTLIASEDSNAARPTEQLSDKSRMDLELKRIHDRLRSRRNEHEHTEACERSSIIMANLLPGHDSTVNAELKEGRECVDATRMFPVWLDVTLDGTRQLALVRLVTLAGPGEGDETCRDVVQGVLIDWEQLRSRIESEVRADDLFRSVRIVPRDARDSRGATHLTNIPAKLVLEMPDPPPIASASYDVMWGLGMAWCVLITALGGIVYGTIKYLGLLERRMRFTAAVTHELRTPLTSFQLYTDLLSELDDGDKELRAKYIGTLRSESKRLTNLVENVLVYSKVNDAAARIHTRAVSPTQILDELREETARRCEESNRSLVINDTTNGRTQLETDPEFVRQILASLVDNACKYSDATGPIWIDATPTRGGVVFEVDDGGQGVDPNETRVVFEPFRRGRDADRARAGGMGLGLALSRYWAACLDGRLSIKRSERNGGHFSRFALDLPSRPRQA